MKQIDDALVEKAPNEGYPGRRRGRRCAKKVPPPQTSDNRNRVEPWGSVSPEFDPIIRARAQEPALLCATLMLRDALLKDPEFLKQAMSPGVISVIHVSDVIWGRYVSRAWDLALEAVEESTAGGGDVPRRSATSALAVAEALRSRSDARHIRGPTIFEVFQKSARISNHTELFKEAVANGKAVHVVCHDGEGFLAPEILIAEQQRLVVPPLSDDILRFLSDTPVSGLQVPSPSSAEAIPDLDRIAEACSPFLINAAANTGHCGGDLIHRLRILIGRQTALSPPPPPAPAALTLDDLPGLGPAGIWGRQVAADLAAYARGQLAWSEMDRGVVLTGPPGTGKSSLARAMAGTAGVPLIAASLAQWQGHKEGHLGTLLSAMRASFALARQSAPCILLIDEIDSFPSRASVTHRQKDYTIQVVNALLEELDGATGRAGVFVIGTCNDAGGLDPALVRAGRLERIIQIDRPDAVGIAEIMRICLRNSLPDVDLKPLSTAAAIRRPVGADIEAWCRGARRRARVVGRDLILDDLIQEIGEPPPLYSSAALERMAIHEAGHAVAFSELGQNVLQRVVVDPAMGSTSATSVDTTSLHHDLPHASRDEVMLQLRAVLAGRAAEEVILAIPSGGAGGSDRSDLARATSIACMLVASSGLDDHPDGLVYLAPAQDIGGYDHLLMLPDIRRRVSEVLRHAYADALAMIRSRQIKVRLIADILLQKRMMSGRDVKVILAQACDHDQPGDPS